ncbi:MAG: hypothetical protein IJU95_01115, partial [Treponema sp.]|nr:hypothetical protein [Treponema sp.]
MKRIVFFLIVFVGTNISPCKKMSFLEIVGQKDGVLITVKMDFPPRFSFNILEGLCYRTYGSIKLENKGNKACKLFFVDLNVNGNFFKCKNTGYSIMRYVDDFLEANQ